MGWRSSRWHSGIDVPYLLLLGVLASGAAEGGVKPTISASICENALDQTLSAVRGACPTGTSAVHIAGANLFDAWWLVSSGMDGMHPGNSSDGLGALRSARAAGIRIFRFFGVNFGVSMSAWVTDEGAYWREFDRFMDTVESLGMYLLRIMYMRYLYVEFVCKDLCIYRIYNYYTEQVRRAQLLWTVGRSRECCHPRAQRDRQ